MENSVVNNDVARKVAAGLLNIEAIKLSPEKPFQWASGWNSPIYCDNRLSLSFPELRSEITNYLCEVIKQQYPDVEAIAGVATAGIPQGALIAAQLNLPMLYVRSKAKSHGMTNTIEGKITKGQKVIVIEDLISTGGSSLKAVEDLRNAEIEVLGMCAIFTYGFQIADNNFENAKVKLSCLSNYDIMIEEALSTGYVKQENIDSLKAWRLSPSTWNV